MIARASTVRALEDRIRALEADQRAVRDELTWIRETALPGIVSEHDDAVASVRRLIDSRTGHRA